MRNSQLVPQRSEVLFHQFGTEPVMPRRNRRVRRENYFARNLVGRRHKVHALFLHAITNGLQYSKTTMSFVQMQHAWRNTHRLQRAEPTNSQQQFLAYSRPPIAAVEA